MNARIPTNETERLKALYWHELLDTMAEEVFDDLTLLASHICNTPIALITLVDKDRQWFKSKIGLDTSETPRDIAFCGHAILQSDVLEVKDALKDQRFVANPLVTAQPHVRFYAGARIKTLEGYALGTVCVIDQVPRKLTPKQTESLTVLSRIVAGLFRQRRYIRELERTTSDSSVSEPLEISYGADATAAGG